MLPHHVLEEAVGETPRVLGLRLTDQFARGYPAWKYVGMPNNSWADIPTKPYFPYGPYRHPGWGRGDLGH